MIGVTPKQARLAALLVNLVPGQRVTYKKLASALGWPAQSNAFEMMNRARARGLFSPGSNSVRPDIAELLPRASYQGERLGLVLILKEPLS